MIEPTLYRIELDLLKDARILFFPGKQSINQPTGRFFYDPWVIKPEFKGTIWNQLIDVLPEPLGETRIITLEPGTNYQTHADIDDRYHLNLRGEDCFLINLETRKMYPTEADGIWYDMNAGFLHTAANFGRISRMQLVIRKLLIEKDLYDPVQVTISVGNLSQDDSRFIFDRTVSPWLNKTNKLGFINSFRYEDQQIKFTLEKSQLKDLNGLIKTTDFRLDIQ